MKINQLDLQAYGHFTDKSFDFSGRQDLHIIFGQNEAGKSTVMRALDCFFFGFGHISRDAFMHEYKDLAVRAVLEDNSGKTLDLTRYKRKKNDLVCSRSEPVDSGAMAGIMSGMTREMYASMFGLDHFSLRKGAEEILTGGGHLGETLFAAASGVSDLNRVLTELRSKADELFRPRASSRPVLQGIKKISELKKQLGTLSLRAEEWRGLQNRLKQIQKDREDIELQIKDLQSRLNRYRRYQKALPLIAAINDLASRLDGLKSMPALSPDFSGKRIEVQTKVNGLKNDLQKLADHQSRLSAQLEQTDVCGLILCFESETKRLFRRVEVICEARDSLSSLELNIKTLQELVKEKAAQLPENSLQNGQSGLLPGPARVKKIAALAGEMSLVKSRISQMEKDVRTAEKAHAQTIEQLALLPGVPDTKQLEAISRKMSLVPELIKQESGLKTRIKKLESGIEKGLNSLGLWQGDVKELANLALPMRETIDIFEERLSRALKEVEFAEKDMHELCKLLAAKKMELSGIDPDDSIPDPESLSRARSLRDKGWGLIKQILSGKDAERLQVSGFLEETGARVLTEGFEKSLAMTDKNADILLEKADQAAAKAGLLREIDSLKLKEKKLAEGLEAKKRALDLIRSQWKDIWSGSGIEPLSPREMSAWLASARDILRVYQDLEDQTLELQAVREKIGDLSGSAVETLSRQGFDVSGDADPDMLCGLVEDARDTAAGLAARKADLDRDQQKHKQFLEDRLSGLDELNLELEKMSRQWVEILSGSNFDPQMPAEDILEEIRVRQEICSNLSELESLTLRKADIEKKCQEFADGVAVLSKNLKFQAEEGARPEDVVSRLHASLQDEQERQARKSELKQRLKKNMEEMEAASRELAVLEGEMSILCREAGTDDPQQLQGIEKNAALKKELEDKQEHILDRLRELSAGEDMESFLARAGEFNPDELQGVISGLESRLQEASPRLEALVKEGHETEIRLKDMDGTSKALETGQEIQEQRALLEDNIDQYIRYHLASSILAAEIERFRKANQGPFLKAAGKIFREITLGSFLEIRAEYDEQGEPIIQAVRDSGAGLKVDELSDGTRDQLFLALRLGGIYRYFKHNPAFPFIVDDILVHFDDPRSLKTLSVLAGLSEKTQVLFFTHHSHILDLVKQIPENDKVKVHEFE